MELKQVIKTKMYEKDGYEIEMYLDMSMEVYDLIKDVYKEGDLEDEKVMAIFYDVLPIMLKDWNLADTENKKMEITKDNLRRLPVEVFSWLVSVFSEIFSSALVVDKKKQLS